MIHDQVNNQPLVSQALAKKGSSGTNMIAKTGAAAVLHKVENKLVSIAAATDVFGSATDSDLDLADGYQAIYAVVATLNAAGTGFTYETRKGTSVLSTAVMEVEDQLVQPATGEVVVGYIHISNGTGSAYVYGTTPLDTSNLTVTYISPVGIIGR